ncbi:DNA-binding protein [Burkholderia vietnamiensis]|uniref:DNA-binding protein n=1 Tax=Burkholderia vietnamiensis TaxID=60552 RepID=UPI001B946916|nr:DNA-binding protein [Burkholderia vietnamiensis]MBR8054159.1 DNA-binding protein [Burkholderia vietnamiensis]
MTEVIEKLFRTPEAALIFAFNYSMQQQDRPAMNRMAMPAGRRGIGLAGLDGAGQGGMILRELDTLSTSEMAALLGRYAPRSRPCACGSPCCSKFKPNPEWEAAIRHLEQEALSLFSGHIVHYRLRRKLVEKSLGIKVELHGLARECGVSENTASAHWKIIREWMEGVSGRRNGKAKRERVEHADVDASDPHIETRDGLLSRARKRSDEILTALPFIGE